MKHRRIQLLVIVLVVTGMFIVVRVSADSSCKPDEAFCYQPITDITVKKIQTLQEPTLAVPVWLGTGL